MHCTLLDDSRCTLLDTSLLLKSGFKPVLFQQSQLSEYRALLGEWTRNFFNVCLDITLSTSNEALPLPFIYVAGIPAQDNLLNESATRTTGRVRVPLEFQHEFDFGATYVCMPRMYDILLGLTWVLETVLD